MAAPDRRIDSQIRSKTGKRHRLHAQFGALALSEELAEQEIENYQQRKGELQEQIQHLDVEIEDLKQQRKETVPHIPVKSLPEEEWLYSAPHRTQALPRYNQDDRLPRRNQFGFHSPRTSGAFCDARTLIRQIFKTAADVLPDLTTKTFDGSDSHLTQAAHDDVLEKLCAELNENTHHFPPVPI